VQVRLLRENPGAQERPRQAHEVKARTSFAEKRVQNARTCMTTQYFFLNSALS